MYENEGDYELKNLFCSVILLSLLCHLAPKFPTTIARNRRGRGQRAAPQVDIKGSSSKP